MSILDLIRPELKTFKNYVPSGDGLNIRLHTNELPWQPFSLPGVSPLNQYPDESRLDRLKNILADRFQAASDELLVTRGSDDAIDLLMRLFISAGQDSILQCPPAFPMYGFYARLQHAGIMNCPLDEAQGFDLSLEKLFQTWQPGCKIIFLCRPNNPTGNLLDEDSIAAICDEFANRALIVVDEAYIEFSETSSAANLLPRFDNLLILRTLSKAHGLAGLRLGCVIAKAPLIKALQNIRAPYLVPGPVTDMALAALSDNYGFRNRIRQIIEAREALFSKLKESHLMETVYPSRANFLLIKTAEASGLAGWFAKHDIAVRGFQGHPQLNSMIRITVGSEEQNQRLIGTLGAYQA